MDEPIPAVEFETMLLGRHLVDLQPRSGERLDRSAYLLLSRLRFDGALSIGELVDAFGLDTSTLHRQTAALLRDGLAERIPDPAGGIARKFRITAEGERRLEADRLRNIEGLGRILAGWSAEEVADFAAQLHRFNSGIERLSKRPWPRPGEAGPDGESVEPAESTEP